jgi:hypothetical protein
MNHEAFLFDAVTPCPEPAQPAALLAEIEAVIKNHVVLPEHAAAALAVWVLHMGSNPPPSESAWK